jgi:hypothetical protein
MKYRTGEPKNFTLKIPLKRAIIDYVDHVFVQEQILPRNSKNHPKKEECVKIDIKCMKIVELKMQQLIQQTYMACVSQSVLN